MKRKLLIAAVLLVSALGGFGAWWAVGKLAKPDTSAAVSQLMALKLPDSDGKIVDFAQWRGKPLVVNFWATWCPPCREEMPLLDKTARANPDVQFVGLSVDDKEHVSAFRRENTTTYPLPITGMEITGLAGALGNKAMALPFTAFISADGELRQVKLGELKEAELAQFLTQIKNPISPK